jgi:hypothetical protein
MKCIEFKDWLENRDIFTTQLDISLKQHMEDCSSCSKLYELDSKLENIIQKEFCQNEVPSSLVNKIDTNLSDVEKPGFFQNLPWGKLIPALSLAVFAVYFFLPVSSKNFQNIQQISNLAVQDHLKGNFKMTFNEKEKENALKILRKELGFNIALPDLTDKGFTLLGGRKCSLGKCDATYLFYKKLGKISSLFILNYEYLDFTMSDGSIYKDVNKGCGITIWKDSSQVYAFVN